MSHQPNQTESFSRRPLVIGISGGSGSGKTHLAHLLAKEIGEENVLVLSTDQYYWTTDDPTANAEIINFDHPSHLDVNLILKQVRLLQEGKNVFAPGYDYQHMTRVWATEVTKPRQVIILEGLFTLSQPLVNICDLAVFLEVAPDERLLGRILRDTRERGASIEQVIDRYQRFVRPSYEAFIAPSKQNADLVVDFSYRRTFVTSLLVNTIRSFIESTVSTAEFATSLKGNRDASPLANIDCYMPICTDINLLAQAYPESVTSYDSRRDHLASVTRQIQLKQEIEQSQREYVAV